jgi:hypothetical protein
LPFSMFLTLLIFCFTIFLYFKPFMLLSS